MTTPTPRACVVIPAHNEATVIGRCLRALADDGVPLEVVVAANACTDDTAARARAVPGVNVVETPVASKPAALNLGDAAGTVFPRIYLDADIELRDGAVAALVAALSTKEPRVAAPQVRFDTERSSWGVRHYYEVFTRLPYATQGLVGLGVYGVSAAGRARFDRFPDLQADDTFVQRLFAPHERLRVEGSFVVRAPRNLRSLIRVRTRIAQGNTALARHELPAAPATFAQTTHGTTRALAALVRRRPTLAPSALVYLAVTVAARLRAARPSDRWHRDESTR
ncbi:MAG: glycosyltransferase [Austwickia sp.]|nr:glycosyltransferase [Austwickia sp.]